MAKWDTFSEAFSSGSLPATLSDLSTGGSATVSAGDLILTSGTSGQDGSVLSSVSYDLSDSSVFWEMRIVGSPVNHDQFLYLIDGAFLGHGYLVQMQNNLFRLFRQDTSVPTLLWDGGAWDSTAYRFARFRMSGVDLFFDTAPPLSTGAPGSWTNRHSEAALTNPAFTPLSCSLLVRLNYYDLNNVVSRFGGMNADGFPSTVMSSNHHQRGTNR